MADTLGVRSSKCLESHRPQGLNGLLRTVAELEYHDSNPRKPFGRARAWLAQRRHWSDSAGVRACRAAVAARAMLVEKSPSTVLDESRLVRLQRNFPEAFYLHLTRHPRSTCKSIYEIQQKTAILGKRRNPARKRTLKVFGCAANLNILHFTRQTATRPDFMPSG
ncbi:MAG: hypothetical protein V9H25_14655 [Candidatus Competibacter sp.]